MLGSYRARVAPFNVNYRYVGEELQYLLNDARPKAMILHSSLAPTLAEVLPTLDSPPDVLLQVEDESGHPLLPGAVWYEEALAASSPEDHRWNPPPTTSTCSTPGARRACPRVCCGASTTSSWRPWAAGGGLVEGRDELRGDHRAAGGELPGAPHDPAAAHARRGAWACFMLMATGATLIFPDDTHRVDPPDVWAVVEREKANSMTIVGDAVLRPLLLQLDKQSYDLSAFFAVGNGGAPLRRPCGPWRSSASRTWSSPTRRGRRRRAPRCT